MAMPKRAILSYRVLRGRPSVSSARVTRPPLAASAARNAARPPVQPQGEPAPVLRAYNPPRIETADYALRNRDAVIRGAAPAARSRTAEAAAPAVFSG